MEAFRRPPRQCAEVIPAEESKLIYQLENGDVACGQNEAAGGRFTLLLVFELFGFS